MRGINNVVIGGNVSDKILTSNTSDGTPACSFSVASDRPGSTGATITCWTRINAYGGLAELCIRKLAKGLYVVVSGELMNRPGVHGELTEVRAKDIVFTDAKESANG